MSFANQCWDVLRSMGKEYRYGVQQTWGVDSVYTPSRHGGRELHIGYLALNILGYIPVCCVAAGYIRYFLAVHKVVTTAMREDLSCEERVHIMAVSTIQMLRSYAEISSMMGLNLICDVTVTLGSLAVRYLSHAKTPFAFGVLVGMYAERAREASVGHH